MASLLDFGALLSEWGLSKAAAKALGEEAFRSKAALQGLTEEDIRSFELKKGGWRPYARLWASCRPKGVAGHSSPKLPH